MFESVKKTIISYHQNNVVDASQLESFHVTTYSKRGYVVQCLNSSNVAADKIESVLTKYFEENTNHDVDSLNWYLSTRRIENLQVVSIDIIRGFKYDKGGCNFAA